MHHVLLLCARQIKYLSQHVSQQYFIPLPKTENICHCKVKNEENKILCPHYPPHPLLPTHPLIRAICDITVVVKKLLKIQQCQLATVDIYETLAKRLVQLYTVNLARLQSSIREARWLQYLKSVFLVMQIVTTWQVFQNQVTNKL